MTTTASLLEIRDLTVEYHRGHRKPPLTALRDACLTVAAAETVALVGESGSGKSTLGNAVLGLVPATTGAIAFDGEDWAGAKQQFPVVWTPCRFGGDRPWFVCSVYANGTYCGRQVTKLYNAGRLFACRHCSRLAYASQQESAHDRGLRKAQTIRMRLGGSANMLDDFPEKPKGMHWRTYERLCRVHDAAQARSIVGLTGFVKRLRKRAS